MIKVSIIVPVYNVELYLRECLDSIINQTLKDIEIICVDDCSTDNSYIILDEYSKKDSRIKLLKHNVNKGLGPARNTGINVAQGEYIGFIDSDDYISLDYFENLYNTAKKYNSDIVSTLNIKLYEMHNNKIKHFYYSFKKKEYASTWNLYDIENPFSYNAIAPYAWNKIYRRDFLLSHELFFMNIKFGCEDANFTIKYMAHKPSISFNNKSIIYYRQRSNSLTNIVKNNIESTKSALIHMLDVLEYYSNNFPDLLDSIYFKVWVPIFNFYSGSSEIYKIELFNDIKKIAKKLYIKDYHINKKSIAEVDSYENYLSLISSNDYKDYLYRIYSLRKMSKINYQVTHADNYFKFFAINNDEYYFTIIIFGVKISIKKKWTII